MIPGRIGIWNCWLFRRGENRSTRRKTSRSKGENQQQTHTHMASTPSLNPGHIGGRRVLSPLRYLKAIYLIFNTKLNLNSFV